MDIIRLHKFEVNLATFGLGNITIFKTVVSVCLLVLHLLSLHNMMHINYVFLSSYILY